MPKGIFSRRFGPSDFVSREQAVTLLQRCFAPEGEDGAEMDGFLDAASVQPYARASMRWAIEHGVITGVSNNGALYLKPGDPIPREQAASVIMRCMMNLD